MECIYEHTMPKIIKPILKPKITDIEELEFLHNKFVHKVKKIKQKTNQMNRRKINTWGIIIDFDEKLISKNNDSTTTNNTSYILIDGLHIFWKDKHHMIVIKFSLRIFDHGGYMNYLSKCGKYLLYCTCDARRYIYDIFQQLLYEDILYGEYDYRLCYNRQNEFFDDTYISQSSSIFHFVIKNTDVIYTNKEYINLCREHVYSMSDIHKYMLRIGCV
jgi:hypothetical protein